MSVAELQYLSDERGELMGVVVPIAVWREISAELETQHLLRSDAMKRRLLEAMGRDEPIPFAEVLDRLGIDEDETR